MGAGAQAELGPLLPAWEEQQKELPSGMAGGPGGDV